MLLIKGKENASMILSKQLKHIINLKHMTTGTEQHHAAVDMHLENNAVKVNILMEV